MNTLIYDFVCTFFPKHKKFWENLTQEEYAFLNVIPYHDKDLKRVLFYPEENIEEVEKYRNKINDLKTIISHRECVFDFYLFKHLSNSRMPYYASRFDFFLLSPQNMKLR